MVAEGRLGFLILGGQGDPSLDAVHGAAFRAQGLEAFGMGDAASRSHPVDLSRPDHRLCGEAIAVGDLAVEQIADGGKADVWMRPDVDAAREAWLEGRRSEVVEEDERPDHATGGGRQDAADFEAAAQVVALRIQDQIDHITVPLVAATLRRIGRMVSIRNPVGGAVLTRSGD